MAATVHLLRPLAPPIAGYLRVGHTGHRKLLDLHAGGRLSFPEARRAEHFLLRRLDPAIRSARYAARLKISDEKVLEVVAKAKVRLVRLRDAPADLHEASTAEIRSRAVSFRGGAKVVSAVLGR
jgi:hypothetical protein